MEHVRHSLHAHGTYMCTWNMLGIPCMHMEPLFFACMHMEPLGVPCMHVEPICAHGTCWAFPACTWNLYVHMERVGHSVHARVTIRCSMHSHGTYMCTWNMLGIPCVHMEPLFFPCMHMEPLGVPCMHVEPIHVLETIRCCMRAHGTYGDICVIWDLTLASLSVIWYFWLFACYCWS